ncbi:hypothetical protein [Longimicrobium sp.]|uniref:hypothetical protein n=1 Tax=Longimicrobium sp. TaxID=2029185 RepID=UPI003B3A32BA
MKSAVFALLCVVGVVACGPAAPPAAVPPTSVGATLDQPFELAVGGSAVVAGEALTIRFQEVPSDSRCPTGVQCVWAGNAVVRAVFSKDGKGFGAELNTNLDPKSVAYLTYQVALVSLAPYPSSTTPIPQSQYRATFVVTRTAP